MNENTTGENKRQDVDSLGYGMKWETVGDRIERRPHFFPGSRNSLVDMWQYRVSREFDGETVTGYVEIPEGFRIPDGELDRIVKNSFCDFIAKLLIEGSPEKPAVRWVS
jgi:hypothetical protein